MGTKYEINNEGTVKLLNNAVDPTNVEGGIYYNNVSKVPRYFDGTVWKDLAGIPQREQIGWWNSGNENIFDDFNDGIFDTVKWTGNTFGGKSVITESSGKLNMDVSASTNGDASSVILNVGQIPDGVSVYGTYTFTASAPSPAGDVLGRMYIDGVLRGEQKIGTDGGIPGPTLTATFFLVYLGSNQYAFYFNGLYITTISSVSVPIFEFRINLINTIAVTITASINVDEVKYIA